MKKIINFIMKKLFILTSILLSFGLANSQCKIYNKNGMLKYTSDIVGYYENGKIYNKNGMLKYSSDIIGYCENGKIYNKNGVLKYSEDIVGYYENGKIYNKNGMLKYSSDIIGYYENGKIYNKNGMLKYSTDIEGYYEGGIECAAAAAYIILFSDNNQNDTTSNKTYQTSNYVKPNWWNEQSNLPKWVENYTCINDVGWYTKTDREDKIQVRTPDGEDYIYLYKDGKVVYENKVKAILNGLNL